MVSYEDPPAGEGRCWISDRRRSAPAAVRHERSEARTAVDAVRRRSEYPTVARAQGSIRVSVPRVGSGEIPDQRFPMVGRSSSSDHLSANQNLGRSAQGTLRKKTYRKLRNQYMKIQMPPIQNWYNLHSPPKQTYRFQTSNARWRDITTRHSLNNHNNTRNRRSKIHSYQHLRCKGNCSEIYNRWY